MFADCIAVRNLCNFSLRTASGPEGSSAKQILECAAGIPDCGPVRNQHHLRSALVRCQQSEIHQSVRNRRSAIWNRQSTVSNLKSAIWNLNS